MTLDAVVMRDCERKDQGNEAPTLKYQSTPGERGRKKGEGAGISSVEVNKDIV